MSEYVRRSKPADRLGRQVLKPERPFMWNHLASTDFVAILSYALPLVSYLVTIQRRQHDRSTRLFFLYLFLSAGFNTVNFFTGVYYINNLLIYTLQFTVEYYLLSWMFMHLLKKAIYQKLIRWMMLGYVALLALNIRRILSTNTFDSYDAAFVGFVIIIYCILFFHLQLSNLQVTFIYRTPWFWFITALLFFYSGCFLIFLSTDYIMYFNNSFSIGLWDLRNLLDIVKNIVITIGIFYLPGKYSWKTY